MTSLAILFTIICILQLLIIILWRKPHKLLRAKETAKKKQVVSFLLIIMVILYGLFFYQLVKYHRPHPLSEEKYNSATVYPTLAPNLVQKLWSRKTGSIDNLYFLYRIADTSETTLTKVAFSLRQEYCKTLCIINLYDEKAAFDRDVERITITSTPKMTEWNKKNYVFVADHYLGYLDAVHDAKFTYYPFHDSYYKHVKAGTLNNY